MTERDILRQDRRAHPDDAYDTVINHAAADAIRALLVHPHASPEAGRELRQVTTWLADTHGHDALRDLAETLAADIAELLGAFADANNCDPLDVLDEWNHDVPPPFTPPTTSQP